MTAKLYGSCVWAAASGVAAALPGVRRGRQGDRLAKAGPKERWVGERRRGGGMRAARDGAAVYEERKQYELAVCAAWSDGLSIHVRSAAGGFYDVGDVRLPGAGCL